MKKFLLLLLLLPFLGFSQVDLVQWNGSTDLVSTILNDNIVASNVTGAGITGPTPSNDGIIGSGWPSTGNTIDTGKYFQITLNPILDGSVIINEIRFTYKGGYNSFQVRYSKAADFSTPITLTTVTTAASNNTPTLVSLTNPITVNAGEKIYIRFYAYNGSGDWKLMNNNLLRLRGTITAPSRMIGDYIVGSASGASFPTVSTAVKGLMSVGARGDVRFLLDNTLYNTSTNESFPIVINPYIGNDFYKVTFKPNIGKTVTVSASNSSNTVSAVFKLNGVDRVVFDGSNTENGTSKDLTLYNTTTSTNSSNNRAVIWIASQNNSNGSTNNEIKNIVLKQHNKGGASDYSVGIFAGGTSNVTSAAEAANSYTTVTNVEFNKVGQAIYVNGNSNASLASSNWYIRGNTIGNTSTDNTAKPYVAVNFMNVKDYEVSNNIIDGLINDINSSVSFTHAAIWIDGVSNGTIYNNKIANLSNSLGNGTPQSRGIYINSSNNLIYNNFISNVYSSVNSGGNGIYINSSGSANKIYYNTIVMNNNSNPTGSSCLYINGGNALEIINNIFYNSQTTGSQYAVYSNVSNTAFTTINYNDYYATTIGYLGSTRATLADWKIATNRDNQSINVNPTFVSTTDLHLQSIAANAPLGTGTPITAITTDIDIVDIRSTTSPYMGADEICFPTVGAASYRNPTLCVNTALTSITHATTRATGISNNNVAGANGLPAGVTASWASNTITISGTPTTAGTYTYSIPVIAACGTVNATGTIIVSPVLSAPTVGTITQPTCSSATGSVVLSGLPTGSWVLTRTPGNVATTGTGTSTTIVGLAPGNYTYTVNGLSNGLKGEYYNNTMALAGTPALIRTDGTVNFDWVNGSPDPLIGNDNFSVRWSGQVQPEYSETYTFSTRSDDGIRLWVNGVQIINNWTDHGPTTDTGTIALTAGIKYNIVLEYYENSGGAVSQLSWSSPSRTLEIIPQSRLFPVGSCGSVASTNVAINAQPSPTVGSTTQPTCLTATGSVVLNGLPTGAWVLNRNPGNVTTTGSGTSTTISGLSPGTYTFTVNDVVNGLKGEYYNNMTLAGTPALTRTDATVNFDWVSGGPGSPIGTDAFSVRWSGQVQPNFSDNYTFSTRSDDGIRLSVNGVQIINNWNDHGPTTDTGTIALTAGIKYNIVLEYYENSGGAVSQLYWSRAGQPAQIIPQPSLYSVSTCTYTVPTVVINNQPATPGVPTTGVPSKVTCAVRTGSFTIANYNASYTYSATPSTGVVISGNTVTAPAGTYTVTATLGTCTSNSSAPVVIAPLETVTYNGINWSATPTIDKIGEIQVSGGITAYAELCSCTVNSGVNTTVNSGVTLKIQNKLTVNGTLTFENNASLVQVNDAAINSGNITYKRDTHVYRFDYTYWSSPVKGMTLNKLSPNTLFDRYFSYNNAWVTIRSGNAPMDPGHGYIIRGPQPYPTGSTVAEPTARLFTGIFTGIPNNGVINDLAVVPNRDYLLGNPYPSAIDADEFLKQNSTRLQGTLYFWTHNTAPAAALGTTTYKYVAADYASYNRTGGVGVGKEADSDNNVIKKIPTGKIGAGQGFFAPTKETVTGNILFNNSMRLSSANTVLNNSQFFKVSTNAKTTAVSETVKSRVWLNLTNAEGAFKQILVGYITGATNEYDNGFDGMSYNGNQYVDFYSVNQDKNLVIQGRALPFVKKDSVALGYNTTIKGDFKISIDQVDGIFTTQNVLLEDKELKVQHDLKKEAYTFSTEKGTFNNRFVLRYVDKNAVDEVVIPEVPVEDTAIMVSVKDGEIKINSTLTKLDRVVVYDVAGRKLFQKNKIDANVLLIPHFVWNHQVLVVDVVLIDGTKVSKKIIN